MTATVNVNGRITGEREAVVPVFDHGFLYGEGVYETMRTYGGVPFLLDRHLRRLRNSAALIALPLPFTDRELSDRIEETVAHAASQAEQPTEWYVRLLITRGVGELSYDPAACPTPSVILIVKPQADLPAELYAAGVKTIISSIVRNHPDTVAPMIKSNNLLNCALAMQEGLKRGAYEVIMRNYKGELAECALTNLFIVKEGEVLTPPLSAGLLPGITREFVLELARDIRVPAREVSLRDPDLFGADEAFLTGTTREILAIISVDDRVIGRGAPGPVTKALHAAFRSAIPIVSRAVL